MPTLILPAPVSSEEIRIHRMATTISPTNFEDEPINTPMGAIFMFTKTLSPYTFLNAALLLPGMFFLCQALALAMRITLGRASSRAWRATAFVAALVYSLLLGAQVTRLVHTLSQSQTQTSAREVQVAAQTSEWNRPMPWLHWWATTTTGAMARV